MTRATESDNTRDRDIVSTNNDTNHSQASTTWSSPPLPLSFLLLLSHFSLSVSVTWLKLVIWIYGNLKPFSIRNITCINTTEICEYGGGKKSILQCQRPSLTQLTHVHQIPLRSTDTASYSILTRPFWSQPQENLDWTRRMCFPHGLQCGSFYKSTSSLDSVTENRPK